MKFLNNISLVPFVCGICLIESTKKQILDSNLDYKTIHKFFHLSNLKFNSILQKCNEKHKKKFDSLSTGKYHCAKINKHGWFRKLSDLQIPSEVIDIVSLGPNYSPSQKISKQDIIDTIKKVESSLLFLEINNNLKNEIREKVVNNIMHNFNKDTHISMEDENFANLKITKQFLKNNPDILFTNADKGNLIVWLKKSTCNTKMTDLLNTFTYTTVGPLI